MKQQRLSRGVVAHLLGRAMGLDDPCALQLRGGEVVGGPFVRLAPDPQVKATRTNSTLVVTNARGRQMYVNDVERVFLSDGSPLPDGRGNSGTTG